MKKYFLITFFALLVVAGCKNKRAEELSSQNQELNATIHQRDSVLNDLKNTIAEIEQNIGVNAFPDSISNNLSERIRNDINKLNETIKLNEERYNKMMGGSRKVTKDLNLRLDSLREELSRKMEEAGRLNDQVAQLNRRIQGQDTTISQLHRSESERQRQLDNAIQQLNTAYYVSGSKKALAEKGIITKEGGFLGLFGKVEKLSPTFKPEDFTHINIEETKDISIKASKPKIITVHPPDSYTMVTQGDKTVININDPLKFWSVSKYLVVIGD